MPTRIVTLDVLRGVAVIGIAFVNIVAFAMPEAAYFNPRAYGLRSDADLWAFLVTFVLLDGKMRGLFSFLFGASLLLVAERAAAAGESPEAVHRARMAWLFAFGVAHFVLLWDGDILTQYAAIGMIAFRFRDCRARTLLLSGIVAALLGWLMLAWMPFQLTAAIDRGDVAAVRDLQDQFGIPSPAQIAREVAAHRLSFAATVANGLRETPTILLNLVTMGSETLGYMLMGMAGYRGGLLTGTWSRQRYRACAMAGLGIGITGFGGIAAWMVSRHFDAWSVLTALATLSAWFRPVMVAGWAAAVILALRPGGTLTSRVAAAGRMAFTNYLTTSIILSLLFDGYGMGLFGRWSRAELSAVAAALGLGMLLWSPLWLARFAYGPFEWLWRSAARGAIMPLRRAPRTATTTQ